MYTEHILERELHKLSQNSWKYWTLKKKWHGGLGESEPGVFREDV